jgi:uncharacterized membrane protein
MRSRNSIYLTLTAAFAALYAVGVVFLAPMSFQLFQVRIADALLPLAMLFGWPAVIGLTLGAFVANFFGGLGPVDMIGGAAANFIATFLAWHVTRNLRTSKVMVGVAIEILTVTVIVGSYLSYLLGMPIQVAWLGLLLGSVVAIGALGSMLLIALSTQRMTAMLRSYGLIAERDAGEL